MLNNGGHHTCVARTLNRPRRNGKLWVQDCTLPPGLFLYGFAVASGGLSVQGSGFKVQGSRLRVQGSGFKVRFWMFGPPAGPPPVSAFPISALPLAHAAGKCKK